jgi:hypothetical protein
MSAALVGLLQSVSLQATVNFPQDSSAVDIITITTNAVAAIDL